MTLLPGGKPIRVRVWWFTRGRYVTAKELNLLKEMTESYHCSAVRLGWKDAPFEPLVRKMMRKWRKACPTTKD